MTGDDVCVDVSAVVVSWNTRDLLEQCLHSIAAHAGDSVEIVVVDNGSADGTSDMIRAHWPDVRLIANRENLGYTHANNQAIRISRGRYVLLLNADAMLRPGCLAALVARLEDDPKAAIAGPRLVYPDGRWQRWTAGRAPGLVSALNYFLFLDRLAPERLGGMYLGRDVRVARRVDWLSSACMLVRRSTLERIGLLDERYFVYMDDVDLCQRARDAGYAVWYCPEAEAVHVMGESTRRATGSVSPEALRSFNRYFASRHGRRTALVVRGVEALGFALRTVAYAAAAALRSREPHLRAKARAHWSYFKVSVER